MPDRSSLTSKDSAPRFGLIFALSIGAFGAALAPACLVGQEIVGRLVPEGGGRPVSTASVTLLNEADEQVARTLSNVDGNFRIMAPADGRYRLRVERIGYGSTLTELIELADGESLRREFEVPIMAIALEGLSVSSDRQCDLDDDEADAVVTLWEETRKALELSQWTIDRGFYSFELLLVDREYGTSLDRLRSEAFDTIVVTSPRPFGAVSAERLRDRGFVHEVAGEVIYYGPDEGALLSPDFQALHCFWTVDGKKRKDEVPDWERYIGLGFEPIKDREVSDIEGVFWLDRETGRLDQIQYQYTGIRLPRGTDEDDVGGEVNFRALDTGEWIVESWRIRMPIQISMGSTSRGLRRTFRLIERAGEVIEIR